MRSIGSLLVVAVCTGCSGGSSIVYANLGVDVSTQDNMGNSVNVGSHCVTLPVLLGSRVEETYELDESFSITVSGTREEAIVTSEGATPAIHQSYSVTSIQNGGSVDSFEVVSATGTAFSVDVHAGCSPEATVEE